LRIYKLKLQQLRVEIGAKILFSFEVVVSGRITKTRIFCLGTK